MSTFQTFAHQNRAVTSAVVIAAGMVAGLVVWAVAVAAGVDLEVTRDGETSTVGAIDVAIASLVGGLAATGVHALMAKLGAARRWWPFIGSTALAISMVGPSYFADGEAAVALICMHLAVGAVLIYGLSMVSYDQ